MVICSLAFHPQLARSVTALLLSSRVTYICTDAYIVHTVWTEPAASGGDTEHFLYYPMCNCLSASSDKELDFVWEPVKEQHFQMFQPRWVTPDSHFCILTLKTSGISVSFQTPTDTACETAAFPWERTHFHILHCDRLNIPSYLNGLAQATIEQPFSKNPIVKVWWCHCPSQRPSDIQTFLSPTFLTHPWSHPVEEIMYVCQYKCLEMFPLTFQKLRFEERPAPSCVLRRYAGKANVFIQNWPFALTWQAWK